MRFHREVTLTIMGVKRADGIHKRTSLPLEVDSRHERDRVKEEARR